MTATQRRVAPSKSVPLEEQLESEQTSPSTIPDLPHPDLWEMRRLLRLAFYASIGRRAPTKLVYLPSYVQATKRHYGLQSKNQARLMLAQAEGFDSWAQMMRAALSEA